MGWPSNTLRIKVRPNVHMQHNNWNHFDPVLLCVRRRVVACCLLSVVVCCFRKSLIPSLFTYSLPVTSEQVRSEGVGVVRRRAWSSLRGQVLFFLVQVCVCAMERERGLARVRRKVYVCCACVRESVHCVCGRKRVSKRERECVCVSV